MTSYNCRSLPKNYTELHTRPDILHLFETSDVVALQETWLSKQELPACDTLHADFLSCGVACVDYRDGILVGRPYGGVSFFFRKTFTNFVTPIIFSNCNWCVGIQVTIENTCFTLINVYLPHECRDNEDEYVEKLSILENIIDNIKNPCFAVFGDFNANFASASSKFAELITEFYARNDLIISSKSALPEESYTYISERWGTNSWLDHLLSSVDFHNSIDEISIMYDLTQCDHIPFCFSISTSALPSIVNDISACNEYSLAPKRTVWKNFSSTQRDLYETFTDLHCISANIQNSIPDCTDCNCKRHNHLCMLISAYDNFCKCLLSSSENACITPQKKIFSSPRRPGWSKFVKCKHNDAINAYSIWRDHGKPRQGPVFTYYNRAKLNYKYAVRAIKRNIETIKADNATTKFGNNDYSGFWKAVRKFDSNNTVLPQRMGDVSGEQEICNGWKSHFSRIYNCVPNSTDNVYHCLRVEPNATDSDLWFSEAQVAISIAQLEMNKSCGYDNIFSEHLKFCSFPVIGELCKMLNSFLVHGFLPENFMTVMLKPIFKKGGSLCDWNAYRPIALANCISKLFEKLLRNKLYEYLYSCANQYGYKKKSGTELCLYTFKQIVDCYNAAGSNVYCCFLDASKAYDRVSHKKLFDMLVSRNVPRIFIRILAYWYKYQSVLVKWGKCFSACFSVSNGVRQGSVLSPYLFCVYVDKISRKLKEVNIGCKVKDMIINHLFYADDLCLFCPGSRGLQVLLDLCVNCANELDIIFNKSKCKVMIFKATSYKNIVVPSFFMEDETLDECQSYKYLGHIITNTCGDNADINRQCRSVYAKGNSLIRKFNKCSDSVKVFLFKSYCSTLYTAEL